MEEIKIRDEFIKLGQLLKLAVISRGEHSGSNEKGF